MAWFLLTLGVAGASPFISPKTMELLCSTAGTAKLVVFDEQGQAQPTGQSSLDCPMCLAPMLPLPPVNPWAPPSQPLAHALPPLQAAHIAALGGAPLPPRGPPSLFSLFSLF